MPRATPGPRLTVGGKPFTGGIAPQRPRGRPGGNSGEETPDPLGVGVGVGVGEVIGFDGEAEDLPPGVTLWKEPPFLPPPSITNGVVSPGEIGQETIGTPVAVPAIVGAGLVLGLSAGRLLAALALRLGLKLPAVKVILLNILRTAGIIAMWEWIAGILGIDPSDAMVVEEGNLRPARRRYSIGHNPRVRTLQKVARHTQKLLKRHDKLLREFLPRRTASKTAPPYHVLKAKHDGS